jgi:hypothetical protein
MFERAESGAIERAQSAHTRSPTRSAGQIAPVPAAAIALQRAAGNRLAARELSRWAAHPDKDNKGQFMSDEMADAWNRFNPPLSK